jgi:hypothetical protein
MSEDTKVNGEYHIWFDSFEEFERELPAMIARKNQLMYDSLKGSGFASGGTRWWGHSEGYQGMMKRLREGWSEYLTEVRVAEQLMDLHMELGTAEVIVKDVRRRKRHRRDMGDSLDMHRVWSGDLEHAWERPERVPRRAPSERYATVYVDLAAASMRDARDGIWRAAATMKICDLFTASGISTEIWTGDSTKYPYQNGGPLKSWNAVRIKEFSQPLNEDRLAALSSVGTLRSLGFAMILGGPWAASTGYGSPLNEGLPLVLRERQKAGQRVIRIGECWTLADAKKELAIVARMLKPVEDAA